MNQMRLNASKRQRTYVRLDPCPTCGHREQDRPGPAGPRPVGATGVTRRAALAWMSPAADRSLTYTGWSAARGFYATRTANWLVGHFNWIGATNRYTAHPFCSQV